MTPGEQQILRALFGYRLPATSGAKFIPPTLYNDGLPGVLVLGGSDIVKDAQTLWKAGLVTVTEQPDGNVLVRPASVI